MPTDHTARARLEQDIHDCTACPRLRRHCLNVAQEKRKAFESENYWGRPVAPFGPEDARLFILGLAPAAHGANRTGRIFTGDRSGDWLYRALHRAGFANQALSRSKNDGLLLNDAVISCTVKCAPPDNKPTTDELGRCSQRFLVREIDLFQHSQVYLALGSIAWNTLWKILEQPSPRVPFSHGVKVELSHPGKKRFLLGSYHPSQQNTFTGRLTEPMFDAIFSEARDLLSRA